MVFLGAVAGGWSFEAPSPRSASAAQPASKSQAFTSSKTTRLQDHATRLPAKSLRDEIREIVREEIAPLDRRLLALERVSDTNAVTVQHLREQLTQTLSTRSTELETRFGSKLADAAAAAQSQLARTVEQLEVQLADHLDRLNAIDWAIQRQDVAFARSIDQVAASTSDGLRPRASSFVDSWSAAPPASPTVSRQGSSLNLNFTRSDRDGAPIAGGAQSQRGAARTASSALQQTRAAQADALFEQSMATSRTHMLPGSPRRRLKTYLFDDEPDGAPLMGLIARDAADIERRCVCVRPLLLACNVGSFYGMVLFSRTRSIWPSHCLAGATQAERDGATCGH